MLLENTLVSEIPKTFQQPTYFYWRHIRHRVPLLPLLQFNTVLLSAHQCVRHRCQTGIGRPLLYWRRHETNGVVGSSLRPELQDKGAEGNDDDEGYDGDYNDSEEGHDFGELKVKS